MEAWVRRVMGVMLAVWGCGDSGRQGLLPGSRGSVYEVGFICQTVDALCAVVRREFTRPFAPLGPVEPLFSLVEGGDLPRQMRYVVVVDSTGEEKCYYTMEQDRWASPQRVFYLRIPVGVSDEEKFECGERMGAHLISLIEKQELERLKSFYVREYGYEGEALQGVVERIGVKCALPSTYRLARVEGRRAWWRMDEGELIYIVVAGVAEGVSLQADALAVEQFVALRDSMVSIVRGEGTARISTERKLLPELWRDEHGWWVRGLWRLDTPVMGGLFVARVWRESGRWHYAEGMLFAPGEEKRNRLVHLKAIVATCVAVEREQ